MKAASLKSLKAILIVLCGACAMAIPLSFLLMHFLPRQLYQSSFSPEACINNMNLLRAYVISLERRTDRRRYMASQLKYTKLPYEFFPGIDGKLLNSSDCTNERLSFLSRMHPRTKFNFTEACKSLGPYFTKYGTIGCWQSHLQIYFDIVERAKKTGVDGPVLIFEDDAKLPSNIAQVLLPLMSQLPENWDGLFLGRHRHNCSVKVSQDLCRLDFFWGAHAYLLNGVKAAEKLINISNTEMMQTADVVWLSYTGGYLNFYTTKGRPIVVQDNSIRWESDIAPKKAIS
ncbi:putative collagen beta-1,O-galactosyltransferase [Monocercomonoides exilis]|uniref:putative collagen beta-1,O-galactosyltransferase n=1 Tax=Monocercomonoides exilis TaxID=2049356 RepID=UPI003559A627|nr:putative collagen beta-1,O-galactosyltransferase [Monocercomonoides exilis]|eukprot:MONOS_968.1-p1 / transcript=MONOS_968.1 / gene=MONOS_968 / organism=Monocercomonoides_exilis_PA203 / gene_product=unspecified product / transcript_product=unspecified product / location=Mono_scaffold00016:96863-97723(+) / protein_length=286 / sequence_SO=supercontig / SO=protein_coding / is_pseudo=false